MMLKKCCSILSFFLLCTTNLAAQEIFIIEGDTLALRKEVQGTISLYWNQQGNSYRYFVQKKDHFLELKNEEIEGGEKKKFQVQLEKLTADANISTRDVKFLLYSLKHFTNLYNSAVEENYVYNASTSNIRHRIGFFTGFSNNIYTRNPENIIAPVVGLEYELYDPNLAPRHSAFLQLRQSFDRQEYMYSSTQLSINYRFKLLYENNFDIYIDTELVNFYYSEDEIYLINDQGEIDSVKKESGFDLTAPLSFGIGAGFGITESGIITVSYNDVVAIFLDNNGAFPLDFTVGYKLSL
ncbi:hypothetical protein GCM10007103_25430 [Salinimicrobium marinum]|uniref:Outer membrane protein beta-barrel domain-containing protein n=1 Tax=Salinimicrobium marinum TaxID=680283 RepID=A0A918SH24_9FLAO|nr:hypothetical protein [Salinimicrobium marinum]GHA43110.1 hypothetical protein GCM10007103_25430 [Salinimicrobium marinum]